MIAALWQGMRFVHLRALLPGIMASAVVAITAVFLQEHYGAPAMLFALLLGLSFKFLSEEGPCVTGIHASSTTILRTGVAFLGFRITADEFMALGPFMVGTIALTVAGIICLGLALAWALKLDWRLGLLAGGSVGICGAAAALTISSLLRKDEDTARWTLFTVVGVTALSTVAMIGYPILAKYLGLNVRDTGIFLGATIHDVAQVMGAGYAVSESVGDTAAITKMMRVAMLVPVSFTIAMVLFSGSRGTGDFSRILPWFLVLFMVFAIINSLGQVPATFGQAMASTSRWCLIIGIAALGMRTSFKDVLSIGPRAIALLCLETVSLAAITLSLLGLHLI